VLNSPRWLGRGPVQIGVIGAGKFGPMFRAQARRTPGLHVVGSITITTAPARRSRPSDGRGKPKRQILRGTRRTGGTVLLEGADRRRRRGHHSLTRVFGMPSPEPANRPASRGFGDRASTGRRKLAAGETLDREGGYSEVTGQGRSDGALGRLRRRSLDYPFQFRLEMEARVPRFFRRW
jgi:hypothetical protein